MIINCPCGTKYNNETVDECPKCKWSKEHTVNFEKKYIEDGRKKRVEKM